MCNVIDVDRVKGEFLSIFENLQRSGVTVLEEAKSYQRIIDQGYDADALAERLGMKQVWRVRQRLSLLQLRLEYQSLLDQGHIGPSRAYEMSRLSPAGQDKLFSLIRSGKVSSYNRLSAAADGILAAENQDELFADTQPTAEDQAVLTGLEAKIASVCKILGRGLKDNEIVITKPIDPHRSAIVAEELALIQRSLKLLEMALVSNASQSRLGAA